jgi:hypothetical protein
MPRYKMFYSAFVRQYSEEYWNFGIRIFKQNPYGGKDELATMEWQGDPSNCHWYAGRVEPRRIYAPEQLYTLGSILTTLLGDQETGIYSVPEFVLQRMQEKGWTEVVYDPRFSENMPLDSLLPSSFYSWGDTENAVSVVAETEEAARALIHKKMDEYGYKESKEKWIAAGEQVKLLHTGTRIDKTTAQEMLESPVWYKKESERNA